MGWHLASFVATLAVFVHSACGIAPQVASGVSPPTFTLDPLADDPPHRRRDPAPAAVVARGGRRARGSRHDRAVSDEESDRLRGRRAHQLLRRPRREPRAVHRHPLHRDQLRANTCDIHESQITPAGSLRGAARRARDADVFETDTAFHAGNFAYSQRSVGIELDPVTNPAYTQAQYSAVAGLSCQIAARHGFPPNREHVLGHSQVNPVKSDPGPTWQWPHFLWLASPCAQPSAQTLKASVVSPAPDPTAAAGRVGDLSVVLRNDGSKAWRRGANAAE